jgi:electron transfer flavoprotein beta subunit
MLTTYVLIKQVPDQGSKAGVNPDGTIDRARAKRMLNPFDRFALQAALTIKAQTGGTVTAITMGPPPAEEILLEAIEHGVDKGVLLSDRRLAASDSWATSYALSKVIQYLGIPDLVFCGLQTTDGDTGQVGPEISEILNLVQISYCEDFNLLPLSPSPSSAKDYRLKARRIMEGGYGWLEADLPALVTVANSYTPLAYKSLRGAQKVQHLQRSPEDKAKVITTVTLDTIEADPLRCGLRGSPTIVGKTWKIADIGGSCDIKQGAAVEAMVAQVIEATRATSLLSVV